MPQIVLQATGTFVLTINQDDIADILNTISSTYDDPPPDEPTMSDIGQNRQSAGGHSGGENLFGKKFSGVRQDPIWQPA